MWGQYVQCKVCVCVRGVPCPHPVLGYLSYTLPSAPGFFPLSFSASSPCLFKEGEHPQLFRVDIHTDHRSSIQPERKGESTRHWEKEHPGDL
ncbi:hypothetical protein MHYP_G00245960 [Metynnis hypsauchen]